MKIALITLSKEGTKIAARLAAAWEGCDVFVHASVDSVALRSAKVSADDSVAFRSAKVSTWEGCNVFGHARVEPGGEAGHVSDSDEPQGGDPPDDPGVDRLKPGLQLPGGDPPDNLSVDRLKLELQLPGGDPPDDPGVDRLKPGLQLPGGDPPDDPGVDRLKPGLQLPGGDPPENPACSLPPAQSFDRIVELTERIFGLYQGLLYIAPAGVVVRAISPCLRHKTVDPAVVVVDAGGRWAVSLVGGHEGGANELAFQAANVLGAEPVVLTTTEAVKNLIVGVGCRRGAATEAIVAAVREAMGVAGLELARVRLLASAEIKASEPGLLGAANELGLPLRLIPADEIRHTVRAFSRSGFVQEKVDLPAVAEPAALLAGRRTQLVLPKRVFRSVAVAVARENCSSLE